MKRFVIVLVAALTMVTGARWANARDTGFHAGAKMWINDWVHDVPGYGSVRSDSAVLFGPAIEAWFGDQLFIEGSYLVSTQDYRFHQQGYNKFDRQDFDSALGFMILPGFGIVAGYKDSSLKDNTEGIKDRLYGPLFGVTGTAWIDPFIRFYGRLDFLLTRFKQTTTTGSLSEDSPGWLAEFGIKGALTRQISGSIGYKLETNTGSDTDVTDTFSGLTLGMMVSF